MISMPPPGGIFFFAIGGDDAGSNTADCAAQKQGMTVAACLKNRTDYIENPDKTEQGQYVSSYACSALTADEEFMLSKRQYDLVNGRRQKSDVIAYQIRQSFRPGEITAEEANKVGYELAMRLPRASMRLLLPPIRTGSTSTTM